MIFSWSKWDTPCILQQRLQLVFAGWRCSSAVNMVSSTVCNLHWLLQPESKGWFLTVSARRCWEVGKLQLHWWFHGVGCQWILLLQGADKVLGKSQGNSRVSWDLFSKKSLESSLIFEKGECMMLLWPCEELKTDFRDSQSGRLVCMVWPAQAFCGCSSCWS